MQNTCLVLEGGGMRGLYTSGVLDCFLENDVLINNIIAVSAGSYNALSYLSRQIGRSYRLNMKYLNDSRYINMKRLLKDGDAINTDFIFDEVFKKLEPFDYDMFKKNAENFYSVSTNIENGQAIYSKVCDLEKDLEYIKASGALPLFTKIIEIGDLKLLDGGIADSIPLDKAISLGYDKIILILTRPGDFVMEKNKFMLLFKLRYRNYPNLIKAIEDRYINYNQTLKNIEKLEKEGKIFVIRPNKHLGVSRIEKNKNKLMQVYKKGHRDCLKSIEKIKKYIES